MPNTLFDFTASDSAASWRTVNDTVMGGQSESRIESMDGFVRFHGTVSLDGGGFASVRAPETSYDLSATDAFSLVVRGDGKRYAWTTYTEPGGRVSYRCQFNAPETWAEILVPFDALTPYVRGRQVPSAPAFDSARIRTMGLLIADGQGGPFRIDVRQVVTLRQRAEP